MAMMAITTSNSISVKALSGGLEDFASLAMQFCTFINIVDSISSAPSTANRLFGSCRVNA